jgi:16S rRNA (guanine527-N7)-methyltransferase
VGVSRETLDGLAGRYGLSAESLLTLERLLAALAEEPDAPTSERARADALRTHVADSLSGLEVEALSTSTRTADLGAGAGFPGLVLAAALPGARFDLIESSARKGTVATRLAAAAGIANATTVWARAEEWAAGPPGAGGYDAVTARALAPLAVLAEYAAPLLRPGGVLVAWKGERSEAEERSGAAAAAQLGMEARAIVGVTPFAGSRSRHLHVMSKVAPTPPGYPRRPGMARKRPLA